jgi:hypothetical protein
MKSRKLLLLLLLLLLSLPIILLSILELTKINRTIKGIRLIKYK